MPYEELQCINLSCQGFNYGRESRLCNKCHKEKFHEPAKLNDIYVAVDSEIHAKLHVYIRWGERNILINKFLIGLLEILSQDDKPTEEDKTKSE